MATALHEDRTVHAAGAALGQLSHRRARFPQRRFAISGLVIVVAIGYLIVASFGSAVAAVLSPGQLVGRGATVYGQTVRLQGRVFGQDRFDARSMSHLFAVTDGHSSVSVRFASDLPGGFKRGASVEAQGTYNGRFFTATSLTAKCPTKYQAAPAGQ